MKPSEIRDASYHTLRHRLHGDQLQVLAGITTHGPCTTRQLALRMHWDILNVRPRVTDLANCGLVTCVGREGREGVYYAVTQADWEIWAAGQREAMTSGQQQLI